MGDMADMLTEQGFQMMLDGDDEPEPQIPRRKSCKYCGQTDIHWEQFVIGEHNKSIWRLVNKNGEQHTCQEYRDYWAERSKEKRNGTT